MNPQGKPEFTAFLKREEVVAWLSTLSNEGTHGTHSSCLFNFWQNREKASDVDQVCNSLKSGGVKFHDPPANRSMGNTHGRVETLRDNGRDSRAPQTGRAHKRRLASIQQ